MLAFTFGILGWFGMITGDSASAKSDTVIVKLDSTHSRVMQVNRVLIIGNNVTKERIISRELSLKPGDTISTDRLLQVLIRDKNKIYNLRLFNTVSLRVLELSNDQFDLLIEVVERWYTFPAPIFELSDRNINEWWENYHHNFDRVNYGLHLYQYNFRGRNETLSLTTQFGFSRRFELNYRIPYIDKKQKQGLLFGFDYGEPKNLAYRTLDHKLVYLTTDETLKRTFGMSVTYNYRKSFYETHSFQLSYRTSHISSLLVDSTKNYINYYSNNADFQRYLAISYSFVSEHRDVILYPLKGYQYTGYISQIGLGFMGLGLGDHVSQFSINLTQARHWPLGNGFYLSNFTSGYFSTPKSQPYSLYNALGYRRQIIRGYEIYVIEGPAFFLNKTTFKKRIFFRSWQWEDMPLNQFRYIPLAVYVKSYFDFGYVENYPRYEQLGLNTQLSNRWLGGAGSGFDIVTVYDLVVRLEYTFTREGTHGLFVNLKKEF
jgi:outer membrane protein assembly factor BamA